MQVAVATVAVLPARRITADAVRCATKARPPSSRAVPTQGTGRRRGERGDGERGKTERGREGVEEGGRGREKG